MADEGTASTLTTIAAWLSLVFFFIGIVGIAWIALFTIPFFPDLALWFFVFGIVVAVYGVFSVFSIIFMILWFSWRHEPSAHKTGLIVTGVLGLFLAWFIPGLLVLIAGIVAPGEAA